MHDRHNKPHTTCSRRYSHKSTARGHDPPPPLIERMMGQVSILCPMDLPPHSFARERQSSGNWSHLPDLQTSRCHKSNLSKSRGTHDVKRFLAFAHLNPGQSSASFALFPSLPTVTDGRWRKCCGRSRVACDAAVDSWGLTGSEQQGSHNVRNRGQGVTGRV